MFIFVFLSQLVLKKYLLPTFGIFITYTCVRKRRWQPTPVLLPGKSHGWRSLVGCSPWGCKESDTTERLHFHFSLLCIGEGNGNALHCSFLENPLGQGSLVCCCLWGHTESGTTEQLHFQFSLLCIGEGNGNPL